MKRSSIPLTVNQLKKMAETTKILEFTCSIQREYGAWDDEKKSLLIHSMLVGYVIPPFYFLKENKGLIDKKGRNICNYSCIDGQHRLRSVFAYMNDEFPLSGITPDVEIDGEEYQIFGKKYSELPEEIQDMIKSHTFTIYNLEECTDDEIEEMFFRLNNGSALSKTQIANVKLGMRISKFAKKCIARRFFAEICHFTPAQKRRSADEKALLQAMLLLDDNYGLYDLVSLSEAEIINYAENVHETYDDERMARIEAILDYLESAFSQKEKFLKVINVPMIMLMADKAVAESVEPDDFAEWVHDFASRYNPECEYAQYCGTGSVKKEKVEGRIEVMTKDFEENLR